MRPFVFLILLASYLSGQFVPSTGEITVLGIRVSFQPDNDESTTGDGSFLQEPQSKICAEYLDPPPHHKDYFESQLKAVNNYFRSVSQSRFGIDLENSRILPPSPEMTYILDSKMAYYHPFGNDELQDRRIAEFFQASLKKAYGIDSPDFEAYDVIVIFHAGIGQDFSLPFLDPTPEDIPSTYIDLDFLYEQLDTVDFAFPGVILPETQNHLLYEVGDNIFAGTSDACDYQFALTGTFALMLGFAIGLPPLWDTQTGESGVGMFALMDQGSNNGRGAIPAPPDAWSRVYAGWEFPRVVKPATAVRLAARDSLRDQIIRIDINESEYFLIENRNNWIFDGVDIDSLRWRNRRSTEDGVSLPSYVEILMDSVDKEVDGETGVITHIPNYDLGLPGSGLLIWHIDEGKIREGLDTYSVNNNREYRGVDLEEADGAQDIGYPSIFLFTDPTQGLWSDMWFAGNSEYYSANPGFDGQLPSFGPDTYPNTRSNGSSETFIEINNISEAGKIMTFTVENSLMAGGFPDTSLHIQLFYDFTGDGVPEILGGQDSLWWSTGDSIDIHPFFDVSSDRFQLCVTNDHESPLLAILQDVGDSLLVHIFETSDGLADFVPLWTQTVAAPFPHRMVGVADSEMVILDYLDTLTYVTEDSIWSEDISSAELPPQRLLSTWLIENGDLPGNVSTGRVGLYPGWPPCGLSSYSDGSSSSRKGGFCFSAIGVADVDLDGRVEILATDVGGRVNVMNTFLTFESGFPISLDATSSILARDLFGDDRPELVVQVDSSDIVVLDWRGEEQYRLANPKGSQLRALSQYQGYNCIATESSIWLFDRFTETHGNEWSHRHHDPTNRRHLEAVLASKVPDIARLMDPRRTYNYPNPVKHGATTIRVFVESAEKVDVLIYDIAGYFKENLTIDTPLQGEVNEVIWDVSGVESGMYFANVVATRGTESENTILKIAVVR